MKSIKFFKFSKNLFCEGIAKTKFPYKFGNKSLQPLKFNTESISSKELKSNIISAYNSFLQGLKDKDNAFLKQICEKGFFKETSLALERIGELKITKEENTSIIDMSHEIHLFVSQNRDQNRKKGLKHDESFSNPIKKLFGPNQEMGDFAFVYSGNEMVENCVIRIKCNMSSNKILYVNDQDFENNEKHTMIIECQIDKWKDVFASVGFEKGDLSFNLISKMGSFKDHYEWKISDFDYFLDENKLV